VDFTTFAQNL